MLMDSGRCHTIGRCFLTKLNRNVFNRLSALENSSTISTTTIYLHFNTKGVFFYFTAVFFTKDISLQGVVLGANRPVPGFSV